MQLIMESFRKYIIDEEISTYIKNVDSLTEDQLKRFIITQYANKNITLSEQQLNEVMPKWLKVLGAKAAMIGTVGSLAMGTAAQAGVISDVPVTDKDGGEVSYTLSADELRSLSDAVEQLPDDSIEPGEKDIRKIAPSLDKIADHPTADIDYDNLTSGELRQTLEMWAQASYDSQMAHGDIEGGGDLPESFGELTPQSPFEQNLAYLGQQAVDGDETAMQRLEIMARQASGPNKQTILKYLQQTNQLIRAQSSGP